MLRSLDEQNKIAVNAWKEVQKKPTGVECPHCPGAELVAESGTFHSSSGPPFQIVTCSQCSGSWSMHVSPETLP